ncbi:MAG: biopolymer transport protein TolR [Alphaproteobacteria bacterium]|jgi:biopolymer transport protein TolR
MGASLQSSSSKRGKGRQGRRRSSLVSEINVTPMVDVMLVLLIVFMVAAPMMTVGVPLDLPKTNAGALDAPKKDPLNISITKDNKIYLQKAEVTLEELPIKLKALAENSVKKLDEKIFISADQAVDYGTVMKVMATINVQGFTKIALKTDSDI